MAVVAGFIGGMFSFGAGTAFAAGGAAFGGWVAGAAFSSTILGGLAAKLLTTVAISALTSAMAPDPAQGGGITISTTLRGEYNPETIILGKYATAGQTIGAPYSHGRSDRFLTQVIELCSAPGATLERVQIGDEWVELGDDPHPDFGRPVIGPPDGLVWVKYYDGTQTAADPYLRARYGNHPDRPWTADMIGAGICYAIMTYSWDREDQTSVPRTRFELGGIPMYDLRKDSSAGGVGTHRLDNPATWERSENPAVIAWNIMRGVPLPGGEVWGGNITNLDELPWAVWTAAMNRCDAPVARADGGSEPAYRAGIEVALDQPPAAALEEVFKACSATIADLGYGWGIVVGAPALPVYSFTDDDIIVSKQQELDPFPGIEETHNAVTARYPDPDALYETKEAPRRTNADWEASDAFGQRMANLALPAVPHPLQVQRLMEAWIRDERRFRRHVINLPPDAAHVELIDTIDWSSAKNGYVGKDFSVHEILEDPRTGIRQMSIRERDPEDYDWRPGFELPSVPAPPGTTLPVPESVSGFSAQAITIDDAAGGARRPAIALSWAHDILAAGVRWEIRHAGQAEAVLRGTTQDVDAGGATVVEGVLPATAYEVRARLIANRRTVWTGWASVTTQMVRIGWEDLAEDILDDIDRSTEWMDETGPFLRDLRGEIDGLRDSIAEIDWGNFTVHQQVRREAVAEVNRARAQFVEAINVAASETEAVATRVTTLTATVGANTAAITQEQLARANADGALALDVQTVSASAANNAAAITQERLARANADEAMAADITEVSASLGTRASAASVTALTSRVADTEAGLVAQSDAITQVTARADRTSAEGLFRVHAVAAPSGSQTRIGLRAEATANGVTTGAAMFMDARSDGTSHITFLADRFAIASNSVAGTQRHVPFIVNAGQVYMDKAFIGDLAVETAKIADGAVSTFWAVDGASLTLTASYPMQLSILINVRVRGISSGYDGTYSITRNGAEIDNGTYSVGPYSWRLTAIKTISVPAGTHTFTHGYSGDPADYSQYRMVIMGLYK